MSQSVPTANAVNLSNELKARVEKLRREGQSFNECLEQVVKLGLYQLEYRREANPKKAQRAKEQRELWNRISRDPEAAVKYGLATRTKVVDIQHHR
jgi:hypothetical protein